MSNASRPHGSPRTRLLCPPLSPRVCSNSCPLSPWCNLTIPFSASPFLFCPQSFPAWGSFSMSRFFASSGTSIGALASASGLPKNTQAWFPIRLTGLTSLQSKGLSRVFSTTIQKHQVFSTQPSLWFNSHICKWLVEKNHSFDYTDLYRQNDVSAFLIYCLGLS